MRAIEIALANRIAGQDAIEEPAADPAGRQLALLFFLGLFDRPVERALLPVVFSAASLAPAAGDDETAKIDPIPIKRRLHALDEELASGVTPEWRKQQIEQLKQPLAATQRAVIEARRRVLARRLFAGMHTVIGDEAKITGALAQLAGQGLVSRTGPASIDCHPLVRDFFGMRLKELDAETFRAAHGRLYDHYRYAGLPAAFCNPVAYGVLALKAAYGGDRYAGIRGRLLDGTEPESGRKQLPPSIAFQKPEDLKSAFRLVDGPQWEAAKAAFLPDGDAGMIPLFAAIAHGCAAEREDETFNEVYFSRIARGNEAFVAHKLGLYGQVLAALASFFETLFVKPSPRLSIGDRALGLNQAGLCLRALGRLEDAVQPFQKRVEFDIAANDDLNAAVASGNLSELLVTIGRLAGEDGAVAASERAVAFANRSGDGFQGITQRAKRSDALFQAGSLSCAEALFREAEALQMKRQPDIHRLYSLQGYLYCDLLLARGRAFEAAARMQQIQEDWARRAGWQAILLDDALYGLAIARAALADAPPSLSALQDCAKRSAEALAALRRANSEDHLPRGLLARAEALWRCGDANAAGEPLREAEAIAKRGPMPLFLADAYLLGARIQLSEDRIARARSHRDQAAALIGKHGYGRAAPELAILDAEIACTDNAEDRHAALAAAMKAIRGEPYHDERTGVTIDGGWWGLLPRLEALITEDNLDLAKLRVARDNYNDERDAYLATQEDRPAPGASEAPGVPSELVEHIMADRDARATVDLVLTQRGIGELDALKPEEQHDAIREAVYAVLAETLALKAKTATADPREVPDAVVEKVFAHPEAEGLIHDMMRQYSLDGLAADLPLETKRFIVGKLKEHGYVKIEEPAQPGPPPPAPAKKRGWWPFAGT
jgi:tetratricopeptide (TPR) repeat protein